MRREGVKLPTKKKGVFYTLFYKYFSKYCSFRLKI